MSDENIECDVCGVNCSAVYRVGPNQILCPDCDNVDQLKAERDELRAENERLKQKAEEFAELYVLRDMERAKEREIAGDLSRALREMVSQHMREHNGESKVYGHLITMAKAALKREAELRGESK